MPMNGPSSRSRQTLWIQPQPPCLSPSVIPIALSSLKLLETFCIGMCCFSACNVLLSSLTNSDLFSWPLRLSLSPTQSLPKHCKTEINASRTARVFILFVHLFIHSSNMYCGYTTMCQTLNSNSKTQEDVPREKGSEAVGAHGGECQTPQTSPGWVSLPWTGCLLLSLPDLGILILSAP